MHVEPAEEAAVRGVHILMEKPLATTLSDAHRIISVCEDHGVKLASGFVHRFRDEVVAARRWMVDGLVGQAQVVSAVMNGQRWADLPSWVTEKEIAGGGVLMYNGIHAVDRLRFLLESEVTAVSAQVRRYDSASDLEDSAAAMLHFANGTVASLVANAPAYYAQPAHWDTEIYGTHGRLRVRNGEWADLSTDERSVRVTPRSQNTPLGERYNFVRQAEDLVGAVEEDRQPAVTGQDGLRALEVVLAIYRAAEGEDLVQLGGRQMNTGASP
jgi:predicted dehydrogenase